MKNEEVWFVCDDAKLYAELHVPDHVPAPALLVCHGMDVQGFHYLKIYSELANRACERGYVSLVFDFRGVGKSTGKFDYGLGEQRDVKCALDYLASRPEVLPNRIFVVGHSLGGAVSLYALQGENRVKGLVLWSTPKNHDYNVKKFIKRTRGTLGLYAFLVLSRIDRFIGTSKLFKLEVYGIRLRPRDVRQKLMSLNECKAASNLKGTPLLVLVGENDKIVGVDEAQAVFDSANEPKDLLIMKDADHNYRGREGELIAKTMDWIEKMETLGS